MKIKVVADSCCDLLPKDVEGVSYSSVPMTIQIDGQNYSDTEDLDVNDTLARMNSSTAISTTACPSPGDFAKEFIQEAITFCVTVSSGISGSYNSALVAMKMVLDQYPDKKIFIIDSLSATGGEILLVLKILELIAKGVDSVESIFKTVEDCRDNMVSLFAINKFDNFVKSGRMSKMEDILASVLTIRPIAGDDGAGKVKVYDKVLGEKKALRRMVEMIRERKNPTGETMVITHCNNLSAALFVKDYAKKLYDLKDVLIYPMRNITVYFANDRGVMLAV